MHPSDCSPAVHKKINTGHPKHGDKHYCHPVYYRMQDTPLSLTQTKNPNELFLKMIAPYVSCHFRCSITSRIADARCHGVEARAKDLKPTRELTTLEEAYSSVSMNWSRDRTSLPALSKG